MVNALNHTVFEVYQDFVDMGCDVLPTIILKTHLAGRLCLRISETILRRAKSVVRP
jgi:hypothetical protein